MRQEKGMNLVTSLEETVQTSHPLHAAMVGGGAWFLSGDARVGAVVGAGTLAYMLAFGHSLPAFLGFGGESAASSSKDDPPTVIIPHDWRTVR